MSDTKGCCTGSSGETVVVKCRLCKDTVDKSASIKFVGDSQPLCLECLDFNYGAPRDATCAQCKQQLAECERVKHSLVDGNLIVNCAKCLQ